MDHHVASAVVDPSDSYFVYRRCDKLADDRVTTYALMHDLDSIAGPKLIRL